MALGILRSHRHRGLGRGLLEEVSAWCRETPSIQWLDLGVFENNRPARDLFLRLGFEASGHARDRWRVDGQRITEITMTLRVDPVRGPKPTL